MKPSGRGWEWRPWKWHWQTYISPLGSLRTVWRGPLLRWWYDLPEEDAT